MTKEKAQEYKGIGNTHFKAAEYEKALDAFTNAINEDPADHVLYSNRSGTYINLEMPDLALEDAKKCVELNPTWAKGYSRLGTALYRCGDIKEAEKAFEEGLKIDPNNQALNDGLLLCQSPSGPSFPGAGAGAGAGLMGMMGDIMNDPEIMEIMKEDPQLLMTIMGKLGSIQSNPAEALSLLSDPNPKVRTIFQKLIGKMMGGNGMGGMANMFNPGAEADTREPTPETAAKATEPTPTPPPKASAPAPAPKAAEPVKEEEQSEFEKLKALGNKEYKARNFEAALKYYDQAFEASDKKELIVLSNKAAVYMEMKDFEMAKKTVEGALERRYDVSCSYEVAGKLMARMAAIYDKQGDYASAVEWYEKSLVEDNVRKVRGDLSKAKIALAQKIKEDYYDDEKAEAARIAGNELFKAQKFPEALKEYDEGIKRNPKDARIYSNRAACYLKLFDPPNALRDIDRALEIDPNFVRAWARKGDIHVRMKELHKAMEAYQSGLKIDETDAACREGLQSVMYKIQATSQSSEVDEQQQARAMQDPKIQAILADPQFRLMLTQAQEDPKILEEAMKDPKFAEGIQQLMAAGILKVG